MEKEWGLSKSLHIYAWPTVCALRAHKNKSACQPAVGNGTRSLSPQGHLFKQTPMVLPQRCFHLRATDLLPAWVLVSRSSMILSPLNLMPYCSAPSHLMGSAGDQNPVEPDPRPKLQHVEDFMKNSLRNKSKPTVHLARGRVPQSPNSGKGEKIPRERWWPESHRVKRCGELLVGTGNLGSLCTESELPC